MVSKNESKYVLKSEAFHMHFGLFLSKHDIEMVIRVFDRGMRVNLYITCHNY